MSKSPLIVALDYNNGPAALAMADQLDPALVRVKVGKELFTSAGPQLVRALVDRDFDVFLDLKYHDIPNTVAGAVRAAADLGVWMVNVHASGGRRMMEAALAALSTGTASRPLLTAVTVLTSMGDDDLAEVGVDVTAAQQVERLAVLASDCGLDGVVCSGQEASMLRAALPDAFRLVTPGIRPAGSESGDQTRVMTPAQALSAGVTDLVVGRPVTQAPSPSQAVAAILAELAH